MKMLIALALSCCLLGSVVTQVPSAAAAELLTFRGHFAPVKEEEGASADKAFTVQVVRDEERSAWTLVESGRGAWPWTERFGIDGGPALLYDRGDGFSTVPLSSFFMRQPNLASGSQWQLAGLTYRVLGDERFQGADVWQVAASDDYGPKRSMLVCKEDGCIVKADDRVIIGRGDECKLQWELIERKSLNEKATAEMLSGFEALSALRSKLGLTPQTREVKWSVEQRKLLADGLPALVAQTKEGPLVSVLQAAEKDVQTQESRSDGVAALRDKALGKELTKFSLSGSGGEKLTSEDLKGSVTVLHFWDYRDAPLEEPYGQVGYLDFLARQNKGVKVFGVMVDDRLADSTSRGQALASARKVKAFMNLSYPVLLDEAALLAQVGDPRTTGAKLPLFVVIGKDGKVAHYHSGFYEVKRDQGLAELTAAIEAAK